jgi:hypothetical protein
MDDGMWAAECVLHDREPPEAWKFYQHRMRRQLAEQLLDRLERGVPFMICVREERIPRAPGYSAFNEGTLVRLTADVRQVRTMDYVIPVPRYVETDFRKPSLWQRAKNWFKAEMQEIRRWQKS